MWQNERIFNDVFQPLVYKVSWIKRQVLEILSAFSRDLVGVRGYTFTSQVVKWIHPPLGWVKVNVDGCLKNSVAGGGGLI